MAKRVKAEKRMTVVGVPIHVHIDGIGSIPLKDYRFLHAWKFVASDTPVRKKGSYASYAVYKDAVNKSVMTPMCSAKTAFESFVQTLSAVLEAEQYEQAQYSRK